MDTDNAEQQAPPEALAQTAKAATVILQRGLKELQQRTLDRVLDVVQDSLYNVAVGLDA